jgi:small-conductance mechanosensitive channel
MNWERTLNTTVFGNTIRYWLVAILIVILIHLILRLITLIIASLLRRTGKKRVTDLSDFASKFLHNTKRSLLALFSIYIGSLTVHLGAGLSLFLRLLATFAVLIQVGFWLEALIDFWVDRQERIGREAGRVTTLHIVGIVLKIAVWILVILVAFDNIPGVQITTLIASLGIGGIAVGLAVQSILRDIFASISIALDRPFVIGDAIAVGDLGGTIEHIGLKSVRIRSFNGEQIVISTSDLLASRIHNYQDLEHRLVVLTTGVSYETPSEKVQLIPKMLEEIISSQEKLKFARSHLKALSTYSLDFETVYTVEDSNFNVYMDKQQAVNLAIFNRFQKEGIEFASPTQNIFVKEESEDRNPS